MKCKTCEGQGFNEYVDYDYENEPCGISTIMECMDCGGSGDMSGYSDMDIIERLLGFITTFDIDEDICKKTKCPTGRNEGDYYSCADCILSFFSTPCKWEQDGICVSDKSKWCADFVDNTKCGRCNYFESKPKF